MLEEFRKIESEKPNPLIKSFFDKAKKFYEKAIAIDENNKTALEYQGEFFAQIGEMEKAKENLEKLLSLCPNSCKEYEMLKDYISGKAKKS